MNPSNSTTLNNWVFIFSDGRLAKDLRSFETWVLINNNLCGKVLSSLESPTTFDESFKVTSVPYFIRDFDLSSRIC